MRLRRVGATGHDGAALDSRHMHEPPPHQVRRGLAHVGGRDQPKLAGKATPVSDSLSSRSRAREASSYAWAPARARVVRLK
jgi:hypothetical protein